MGYGCGDMGFMWPWMLGWSILLIAVLAALVWGIVRLARGGGRSPDNPPSSARIILDERYARGEIGEDEYRTRRETLG
ncbi:SHOCT domain-containing protein [Arthrobacter sp. PO-11]|uniref:SHOCT domain-containing protein n=2 Tax=Arthrobacter cavernae TaxID=2817681 RepID=A0A939HJJ4_9MICC|nr:SHOCT domain-containing protein [Arthrobacter cavernae]